MKHFKITSLSLLFFFLIVSFAWGQKLPQITTENCELPSTIMTKLTLGIRTALSMEAAFFIDPNDLDHVHFLVNHASIKDMAQKRMTAVELMELTEAFLFHSQEFFLSKNPFPMEIQKRRNIFMDLKTNQVMILDTNQFQVNTETFTVYGEKDLKMKETFQIGFDRIPEFVDWDCKLPKIFLFSLDREVRIAITEIVYDDDNANQNTRCYCSGLVKQ